MPNCPMCWTMVPLVILGGLLLLGVIALVAYAVVRATRGSGDSNAPGETSLTILERRYARGEISAEQFETMKRQLSQNPERQ